MGMDILTRLLITFTPARDPAISRTVTGSRPAPRPESVAVSLSPRARTPTRRQPSAVVGCAASVRGAHRRRTNRGPDTSMRILVAGGAGMIGSHLCAELLSRGHEVICADNLITGRRENLAAIFSEPGFRFLRADVVDELPALPRLDRVYHLASPASPSGYARLPLETLRVNSEGTRRLLELAQAHGARFLYASAPKGPAGPPQHPQSEDDRGNARPV